MVIILFSVSPFLKAETVLCWCLFSFELMFVCMYPFFFVQFTKESILSPLYFLISLSQISWPYICRLIPGLSVSFHWSICLFSFWCIFLIAAVLWYIMKSETMMSQLLFFLKIVLAIWDSIWILGSCISYFCKINANEVLIGSALDL